MTSEHPERSDKPNPPDRTTDRALPETCASKASDAGGSPTPAEAIPTSEVHSSGKGQSAPDADVELHPAAQDATPTQGEEASSPGTAAATPALSGAQPPQRAALPGELLFVGRWRELTDPTTVWFARPTEVGHRQRLAELIALAAANSTGGVRAESLSDLLAETKTALLHEEKYVAGRFPEVVAEVKTMTTAGSSFRPSSAALGSVEACLGYLSAPKYLDGLVDAVCQAASKPKPNREDLRKLATLTELLDAELAHSGHSLGWRADNAATVATRLTAGEPLTTVLPDQLTNTHAATKRDFDVIVPLTFSLSEDEEEFDAPDWSVEAQAAMEVVNEWPQAGRAQALAAVAVVDHVARFSAVSAADSQAALRDADDQLRRRINVWRLLGRPVAEPHAAVIYDPLTQASRVGDLPTQPLDIAPDGLDSWTPEGPSAPLLNDAIDQLAQARTARPAAAFVDLWTAAEALYGGGVEDRGYHAGLVMAGMAEYMFIHDSLVWVARRAHQAGAGGVPVGGEIRWLVDKMDEQNGVTKLMDAFIAAGDYLAWTRFCRVTDWDEGWGLRTELKALSTRLERVINRAYLYRNFAVHRADHSLPGLDALLPAFAGLVKVSVGLSWRQASGASHVLSHAKEAALTVRAVADDFGHGRTKAPDGLNPILGAS